MFPPAKSVSPSNISHFMSIQALFAQISSFLIPDRLQFCQRQSLRVGGCGLCLGAGFSLKTVITVNKYNAQTSIIYNTRIYASKKRLPFLKGTSYQQFNPVTFSSTAGTYTRTSDSIRANWVSVIL